MNTNLKDYIVNEDTSIIDTMKTINRGENAIAFVCDDMYLLAAVSDGDVRRYIINGGDLDKPIKTIANYHPISVLSENEIEYERMMRENSISALPVVNEKNILVDIEFLNGRTCPKKAIGIPVVIMAGGKGSRLKPYTEILPKPLIPIGNKTITEHIIARFEEYNCHHFDMIVNYKKNFIKSYFQDNDIHYDISFVEEPEFWGTAGGLKLVEGKYKDTFFITNCDILIEADFRDIYDYHKHNENIVTMVCARKKVVIPYGTIETDERGQVRRLREKPSFEFKTNTGLYLVEPEFLRLIPARTKIDITDIIEKCIDSGERVGAYLINENDWMDMGQLDEMEKMKKHLNIEG